MDSQNALLAEFVDRARKANIASAHEVLVAELSDAQANADVWRQLGVGMLKAGLAPAAVDFLSAAMDRFPRALELRYWLGTALCLSGRHADAEREFRQLLHNLPSHRGAARSLASMLREDGRLSAAADVIVQAWTARKSNSIEAIEDLVFLRECGAHLQACELALDSHRRWPHNADIAALAAEFALAIGDFTIARRCLHAVLDCDPGNSASWLRLAYCRRFQSPADSDLQRIEGAWQNRKLGVEARVCVGFALGKARDDLGDYAGAVAVLREVNAAAAEQTSWRLEKWRQFVEQQLDGWEIPPVEPARDFNPVFVIGLPRTGTTLVASLLSRDPRLRDRGELNWIDGMNRLLAAQDQLRNPAALSKIATLVSAQMRRDDAPAIWYLDKNPLNFRYLNMIAALFPQARIIHCRRQLPDTVLSLWMQHFAHEDLGFSYDFSSIAEFVHGYRRLMAHWRKTLPVQIFDLEYETLVTDTDTSMHRLWKFLGVPPAEPAARSAPAAAITTASVWQVRQPVYTRSIDRWRNYAACVPELERFTATGQW